mgnify:CR=1 FL=1
MVTLASFQQTLSKIQYFIDTLLDGILVLALEFHSKVSIHSYSLLNNQEMNLVVQIHLY